MNKLNRSIPLAFLLAVAADTSSAAPFGPANEATPVLTRGMLAELLAGGVKGPAAEADGQPSPNTKVAQSFRNFGFLNCFNGKWRNC